MAAEETRIRVRGYWRIWIVFWVLLSIAWVGVAALFFPPPHDARRPYSDVLWGAVFAWIGIYLILGVVVFGAALLIRWIYVGFLDDRSHPKTIIDANEFDGWRSFGMFEWVLLPALVVASVVGVLALFAGAKDKLPQELWLVAGAIAGSFASVFNAERHTWGLTIRLGWPISMIPSTSLDGVIDIEDALGLQWGATIAEATARHPALRNTSSKNLTIFEGAKIKLCGSQCGVRLYFDQGVLQLVDVDLGVDALGSICKQFVHFYDEPQTSVEEDGTQRSVWRAKRSRITVGIREDWFYLFYEDRRPSADRAASRRRAARLAASTA